MYTHTHTKQPISQLELEKSKENGLRLIFSAGEEQYCLLPNSQRYVAELLMKMCRRNKVVD